MKNTILALTVLFLAACGGFQQDPLNEHPLSQTAEPTEFVPEAGDKPATRIEYVTQQVPVEIKKTEYIKGDVEIREVPVVGSVLFTSIYSIDTPKYLRFYAGRETKHIITAKVNYGTPEFTVLIENKPEGATFNMVKAEGNIQTWELAWTPSLKLLEPCNGAPTEACMEHKSDVTFKVDLKKLEMSDKEAEKAILKAFKENAASKKYEIAVSRTLEIPKLLAIEGLPKKLKEGEQSSFSVRVKAPGTTESQPPEIFKEEIDKSTDTVFEPSANRYVTVSASKKSIEQAVDSKGNVVAEEWILNFDFDTSREFAPRSRKNIGASTVIMNIGMRIRSANGNTSDPFTQRIEIEYLPLVMAEAPKVDTPPVASDGGVDVGATKSEGASK